MFQMLKYEVFYFMFFNNLIDIGINFIKNNLVGIIAIIISIIALINSYYYNKKSLNHGNKIKSLSCLIESINKQIIENEIIYNYQNDYEYKMYRCLDLLCEDIEVKDLPYFKFFIEFENTSHYSKLPKESKILIKEIINKVDKLPYYDDNDMYCPNFTMEWNVINFKKSRDDFQKILTKLCD